ncbi:MAG: heat-inducible transcriptional repressor HrcA [Finegoldia sp.]|nr:heat-inducible transcriptional repressor HrcA [Finegoldia sp.]
MNTDLSDRKLNILYSILDSYIKSAQPVGSRTLSKDYDIGYSPATIRNEMSDLSDMGYLQQAHVSGGRIPTDKAYRLYVDDILSRLYVDHGMGSEVSKALIPISNNRYRYVDPQRFLKSLSEFLSEVTKYPTVSMIRNLDSIGLDHIELIKINKHNYALITLFNTGDLSHNIIHTDSEIDQGTLIKVNFGLRKLFLENDMSYLYESFIGIPNSHMLGENIKIFVINSVREAIKKLDMTYFSVDGVSNIFNYVEYEDLNEAKNLIEVLEDREKIKEIFNFNGEFLNISIGSENKDYRLKNNSIISTSIIFNNNSIGNIAIAAPTRMDYELIIREMLAVSSRLKDFIKRGE